MLNERVVDLYASDFEAKLASLIATFSRGKKAHEQECEEAIRRVLHKTSKARARKKR